MVEDRSADRPVEFVDTAEKVSLLIGKKRFGSCLSVSGWCGRNRKVTFGCSILSRCWVVSSLI